jgi:hypothetical protein
MRQILNIKVIYLVVSLNAMNYISAQTVEWAKNYSAADIAPHAVAADPSGDVITIGEFWGSASFGLTSTGGTNSDIFITRSDASGYPIWAKKFGGSLADVSRALFIDANGSIYLAGSIYGTVVFDSFTLTASNNEDNFICKMNSMGNVIWIKQFASNSLFQINKITSDASGNVYATGNFSNTAVLDSYSITSGGARDVFLVKLNSSGNCQFLTSIGNSGSDEGYDITVDANGNIYNTGTFQGTVAFNTYTLTSLGGQDGFAAKLNPTGSVLWVKQIAGSNTEFGYGIKLDSNGDIVLVGAATAPAYLDTYTITTGSAFMAKMNTAGNVSWVKSLGNDTSLVTIGALDTDGSGNYYLAGTFLGTIGLGTSTLTSDAQDSYVTKHDLAGNVVWAKQLGGPGTQDFESVSVHSSGKVYTTGQISGYTAIDNFTFNPNNDEMILAKISTTPMGIEQFQSGSEIKVYPNPTADVLNVYCERLTMPFQIKLINNFGTVVYEQKNVASAHHKVDISALHKGIYFLKLDFDSESIVQKIIIER